MTALRPQRIQLKRSKGWRLPDNAVIISRPSKWGNPFRIGVDGTREHCVRQFGEWIVGDDPKAVTLRRVLGELRGKDLACWCPPGPCHGDMLIAMANEPRQSEEETPHGA